MALRVLYIAGSCAATLATDFNHSLKLRLSLVSLSADFHTQPSTLHRQAGAKCGISRPAQSRAGCDLSDRRLFIFCISVKMAEYAATDIREAC